MFQQDLLKDKVALITGGGTGIGKSIAKRLGSLGARIVIASRSIDHLEAGKKEIEEQASEVVTMETDVRQPERVEKLMSRIKERMGRLDILVNNAAGNFLCPAKDLSPNGWKAVIDIVLNGTFYCSRYAYPLLALQEASAILNIVATYAWTGNAMTIHSAAAKAGVLAMTRTLAVEWANEGIRVNAIAPGIVPTEGASSQLWADPRIEKALKAAIPMGRFADGAEIADTAAFLLSPLASYVTGACLTADGGLWLSRGVFDIVRRSSDS